MLAHIIKHSLPIKDKPNNWLPSDLNRIISSNTSNASKKRLNTTLQLNNMMK